MKLTFLGATHEVTGSCTLLEACGKRFLIDCGMEQGADTYENCDIPVAPGQIDAVFLTHAHIDHSGKIPALVAGGFKGEIYATEATQKLCNIMLRDSAHIQEFEAEWRNRKAQRSGGPAYVPPYTMADAEQALRQFKGYPYGKCITVCEGVALRFLDAGHLLGSSSIYITIKEGTEERTVLFSGDIGNVNRPLIRDPQMAEYADYVVIESTYGDRTHEYSKEADTVELLADYLQETFDRGGNVVIPSFAVGRTQEILYFIRQIKNEGMVKGHDHFPVYVDSPLANEATGIFLQCTEDCFDEETRAVLQQGINPIYFDDLRISVTSEESKNINFDPTPKVIISASGMCEGGRIRHHLKHNLWDKKNLILFVGYQSAGTLGRIIYDGAKKVKIFNEEINIRAQVGLLPGISGHADKNGLLNWINSFETKPSQVFVNHGDDIACASFAECLRREHGFNAFAPYSGTSFDLISGEPVKLTQGIPIEKKVVKKDKAQLAYERVIAAAERLLATVKSCKGRPNKDLARYASQIDSLRDRIKND